MKIKYLSDKEKRSILSKLPCCNFTSIAIFILLITLSTPSMAREQKIAIQVLSATVKNKVVAGAKITFQKQGESSVAGKTNSRGKIVLSPAPFNGIDDDSVLLIIKAAGYSNLVVKCPCNGLTYALSDRMKRSSIRVVLNWGAKPLDLDSHLSFPNGHIYYRQKKGRNAWLDVDDTDSYGPETITIKKLNPGQNYVYAIHNFSDRKLSKSRHLGASKAKIFVYRGNSLKKVYYVTPKNFGTLWVLFGISSSGEFHDINEFTYAKNPKHVGNILNGRKWSYQTQSRVCSNPQLPCTASSHDFQPNELSYNTPTTLKKNTPYYSDFFWGIMLISRKAILYEENTACRGYFTEQERLKIQKMFPNNKVFASRSGCRTEVSYSNTNRAYEFIALFAGDTKAEAKEFLKEVKRTGKFVGPNIRRMQVIVKK